VRRLLLLVVLAAACSDDDAPRRIGFDEVVELVGCTGATPIDPMAAPIRGGAATAGVDCGGAHVFERAPVELGGTDENIARLVGAEAPTPCAWLVVGMSWFVLAEEQSLAERVAAEPERVIGSSPSFSYLGPGGCGSA
jgi:hypothetical protein